jgi:hypothetical protein
MSCYLVKPTDPDKYLVRVGWDRNVNSFFVYVSRPVFPSRGGRPFDDAGHVYKSRGIGESEISTVEELEREVEGYGHLTADVRAMLLADQRGRRRAGGPCGGGRGGGLMTETRYEVTAKFADKFVCFVGWDKANYSYFVYVARRLKHERGRAVAGADGFRYDGHTVLMHGAAGGSRVDTVEEVAELLKPYAMLPEDLYSRLREMRRSHSGPPLPEPVDERPDDQEKGFSIGALNRG